MVCTSDVENKVCDVLDLMEVFGKYQIIQYVFICLPILFVSMTSVNFIFAVADVNYRCAIDKCEDSHAKATFPSWWPDTHLDRCSKPVLKSDEEVCTNSSFTGEVTSCDHWIYESNNTVVAELNLACQPWKSNLVGTIHNTGMMVSLLISGWMCDRFGRKPTLIFCLVGGSVGIIKTFSISYYMYITIEFLESSIIGGSYAAASVLILEIVGKKYRVLSCAIYAMTTEVGECLVVCIAKYVPYWKTFIRVINGPCLLFIFLIFVIQESPRWHLVSGKVEDAKNLIRKMAKENRININQEELTNIEEDKLKERFDIGSNEVEESLTNAVKSKEIVKRLLVACMARFTTNLIYFGMLVNSVWLPGDKYVNYALFALLSLPGETLSLYLMNRFGRKSMMFSGFTLTGALCIVSGLVPERYIWVRLILFLIAKVIISACFTGAITYSMELFPTSVRGSLVGLASVAAQTGGILAPLTPILNTTSKVLPFTIFGCLSILAGVCLCLTPETKGLPLFDTIQQVEDHTKIKINNNFVESSETVASTA